ncbi:hypothetical protein O181_000262 [Austropuccinia psidii MF-1]|uniref:Uncharacterized protein n=1 Tax=Austropuccinia psidii MF-1 TaxID=1389203 RepID=A0A9Q3B8I2_9BASI|nr:hypothetical protein [Austropuccinia psidii MF-1]
MTVYSYQPKKMLAKFLYAPIFTLGFLFNSCFLRETPVKVTCRNEYGTVSLPQENGRDMVSCTSHKNEAYKCVRTRCNILSTGYDCRWEGIAGPRSGSVIPEAFKSYDRCSKLEVDKGRDMFGTLVSNAWCTWVTHKDPNYIRPLCGECYVALYTPFSYKVCPASPNR